MKLSKPAFLAIVAAAVSGVVLAPTAQAAAINGTISFTGGAGNVVVNSPNPGENTLHFTQNFSTNAPGIGDYLGASGTPAFADITWTGIGTSAVLVSTNTPEWSFVDDGLTYSFDLLSLSAVTFVPGPPGSLTINGNGIAHITGLDDTFASFSLQGTGTALQFTIFQASDTAIGQAVPEGGSAVALLGLALAGVEGIRRKFRVS